MKSDDRNEADKSGARPPRRTIMPAYYKMSQDLGPLPKRFGAKRVRNLVVAAIVLAVLALALHAWW